jgi:hypothetical protein
MSGAKDWSVLQSMPKAPIFLNETTARRNERSKNTSSNPPAGDPCADDGHKLGKGTRTYGKSEWGGKRQESKNKRTKKRGSRQADKRGAKPSY